jgi:hypothetical protein
MNKVDTTVYQYGSFEPTLDPSYIALDNTFKGTVRQDLRGVKNRLKRSVLINCKTASLYYFILKGHQHDRSKKQASVS